MTSLLALTNTTAWYLGGTFVFLFALPLMLALDWIISKPIDWWYSRRYDKQHRNDPTYKTTWGS